MASLVVSDVNQLQLEPWATIDLVGGSSGDPFCECRWVAGRSGLIVERMETWLQPPGNICGIRLTYSDGTRSPLRGHRNGAAMVMRFAPGQRIKSLKIFYPPSLSEIGCFDYEKCYYGDYGAIHQMPEKGSDMDKRIASGILIGVAGRYHEGRINSLGFMFLKQDITYIEVDNVTYYADSEESTSDFDFNVVVDEPFLNFSTTRGSRICKNKGQRTFKDSYSWNNRTWEAYGVPFTFRAHTFDMEVMPTERASGSSKWVAQPAKYHLDGEVETTRIHRWDWSASLSPGERGRCRITSHEGVLDVEYTAEVTLNMKDGAIYKYTQKGVFKTVVHKMLRAAWLQGEAYEKMIEENNDVPSEQKIWCFPT